MKIFGLLLILVAWIDGAAQLSLKDSVHLRKTRITHATSLVLSGWGALSLASPLLGKAENEEQRYFQRTNMIFGGVNLALGQIGFWMNRRNRSRQPTLTQVFASQEQIEKIFLFNAALDLAYLGVGYTLVEKGNDNTGLRRERLRGTGRSLLVQGGFLLLFDGLLYWLHKQNGNRLDAYLNRLTVTPTGNGVGLVYRF